ncbi:MAG: DUF1801 domain-containing protein [Bacteroidota bacterium]
MPAPPPRRTLDAIDRAEVAAVFAAIPPTQRERLLELRQLILDTVAETAGVGLIEEALRWGQPSYLTTASGSGTAVRLGVPTGADDRVALYVNCQTTLVGTYRQMYPDRFTFEGNRAIVFHVDDAIPHNALGHCVAMALCYHLDRKRARA